MRTVIAFTAVALMTSTLLANSGHSGASLAWTSNDPVVMQAIELLNAGDFARAQELLGSDDGHPDAQVAQARLEMQEIIRRLRHEYRLDEQAMLDKLRKGIPDASPDDLKKWRDAGALQYRTIDGQVRYFNREPVNLFRFSEEAKARRDKHAKSDAAPDKPKWTLHQHLEQVIAAGEASDSPQVVPIKHRITYKLTIPPNPKGAKRGSVARVWLPFPQDYRQQKDVKLISASPADPVIAPNAIDGKTIGGAAQRTLFFERTIDDPSQPMPFTAVYHYTSFAYYPKLDDAKAQPLPAEWGDAYLRERLPHIAFTPELRAKVAQLVGDETNPLVRARKIFQFVSDEIRYCGEEEYGLIPSFSTKALSAKKGDCGVQGMLFITMCRVAGIPARWQSGWETKPINWNMHDWAEFYIAPWGWLPADPSYGLQKSDNEKIRWFYLGHQDSYRLIGNLDYGSPLHPPKQSLRSEPADFQRGEVEIDGRNLYFDEWPWDFKFEQDPKAF
jgi:hypothetical protein